MIVAGLATLTWLGVVGVALWQRDAIMAASAVFTTICLAGLWRS